MRDRTGPLTVTLTCFVLTSCAACRWENFGLALLFCSLQVLSFLWLLSHFNGDTNNPGFKLCFNIGLGCTFLGVGTLLLPLVGLKLFQLFYTLGTVCSLGSIVLLMEPLKHWETIHDKTKDIAINIMHDALRPVKKALEWLKSEAGGRVLTLMDAYDWRTHTKSLCDCLNSNAGSVLLGLCAFLFSLLGISLFPLLGLTLLQPGLMLYLATQLENILETILEKTLKNETRGTNQNQRMNKNGVEGPDNLDKVINAGIKLCPLVIVGLGTWRAFFVLVLLCILWLITYLLRHIRNFVVWFIVWFIGAGCIILSVWVPFLPGTGRTSFIILYTLGNILILKSTTFLECPSKQLEKIFDDTRAEATAGTITFLVLTLASVFWWKSFVLALTFCILNILSALWYCLSYIPRAREIILHQIGGKMDCSNKQKQIKT